MKKELKIAAVVLAAILVFVAGFGLGASKGINITVNSANGGAVAETAAPAPTAAPVTEAPATTAAPETTAAPAADTTAAPADAPAADTTAAAPSDAPAASGSVPSTPAEIVAKYNEVVNAAKNGGINGSMHKTSNTNIEVTKLSVESLKGTVNSIVSGLIKPSDETFNYTAGVAEDGGNIKDHITPGGRDVALAEAGVANATATADGDGYKMTITLVAEQSTFDGTNTTNPVHHESCLSPLNLATLDLGPAKITSASMNYSGATLNVTVDGQGRMTHYDFKLPMDGEGSGKLAIASLDLGLAGEMVETYDITYS